MLSDAEGTIRGTPINDLPDSSFAYIEPGGEKDEEGKTVPRSKRHFPIKDKDSNCDPAHVRNALARLSQSEFGEKAKPAVCRCTKELKIPSEVCGTSESKEPSNNTQVRCKECGQYMSQEELSSHFQQNHPGKVPQTTFESKHIKLEFIVAIDKMYEDQDGLHITGILSIPRASLNGWIYLPEELEIQDNKTVPMFFEHEEMFNPDAEPIGIMNTFWNESLLQLEYEAIVTNKEKADAIRNGNYSHVSMGAAWEDFDRVRGWLFPKGVEILEGSLVAEPGIPETTVSIIDHVKPKRVITELMVIKDSINRVHLVHPDSKEKFISTQQCTKDFCYAIMKDSHSAGRAKNLPACDKKMSEEKKDKEKTETNENDNAAHEASNKDINPDSKDKGSGQQKRKLLILTADGVKTLLQENSKFIVDAVKDVVSPFQKMMNELPKPNPTARVADGIPNKEKTRDIFYKILSFLERNLLLTTYVRYRSRTRIKFKNQSWIIALPCGVSGATLRGHTANLIILDEAAFIPEEVINNVVLPMLSTTDGSCWMLSTPYDREHVFYRTFNDPSWSVYHLPSSVNPLIKEEFLEEQRKLIGEINYKQEYEAQFVDDVNAYFPMTLIRPCTDPELSEVYELNHYGESTYAGYDPGGKQDPAALIVVTKNKDGYAVRYAKTWLNQDYTTTDFAVIDICKAMGVEKLFVDQTGLGNPILEHLNEIYQKERVQGVFLTQKRKEEVLLNLKLLFEQKLIRIPNDRELLANLNCITYERTHTGNYYFKHGQGTHDDLAYALALAVWTAKESTPGVVIKV